MACLSFTLANQEMHYEELVDNNGTGPLKVPDIHPAQKNYLYITCSCIDNVLNEEIIYQDVEVSYIARVEIVIWR